MDRIDTPGSVAGSFVSANPFENQVPTIIGSAWLNDVQEELVGWILTSGQSLEKGAQTQILLGLLIIAQAQLAASTGRELETVAPLPLASGEMFAVEDLFGVSASAGSVGQSITMVRTGNRTLPKASGEVWLQGETAYWVIADREVSNQAGEGRKRIGFVSGPAESAAISGSVLLDGNSAPETASAPLGSGLVRTLRPPAGYTYADGIGVLNDQKHVAVLWDANVGGSNLIALYDVTTSETPIWTKAVAGRSSHSDRIWVARDVSVLLLLHEDSSGNPIKDQWSKYNVAGQLWETTRYNTGGDFRWGGGLSADGTRVALVGTDTLDNQGTEIIILDGADETPTSKIKFVSIPSSVETAMSASGAVLAGMYFSDYAAHAISVDVELTSGIGGQGIDQFLTPGPGVAVADDGLSFILNSGNSVGGPEVIFVKRIGGTWTEFRFACAPGKEARACAISGDGSKALWVEAQDTGSNAEPVVFVIDTATGAIATDGNGVAITYALTNAGGTASGSIRDVELTQDGSKFLVISHNNGDEATAWVGQTSILELSELFTAPATNYKTRCAGMALDGGLAAVGADAGLDYFVNVYNLT